MKEVKAFVKPKKVQTIVENLKDNGFVNITLSKCEGTGPYTNKDSSPSLDFHFTDSPVVKLELVCQNEEVNDVVNLISEEGKTSEKGDGIIYVTHIENAFKIKTGKTLIRTDL